MSVSPQKTARAQRTFLEAFATAGTVNGAGRLCGIDPRMHRKWLAASERYRAAFERAQDDAVQVLENEARRRATGYLDPVFYQGSEVGAVTRYSDPLLMFLLKAGRPGTYRENRSLTVSGSVDSKTVVTVVHEFRDAAGTALPAIDVTPLRAELNAAMDAEPVPAPGGDDGED
jgi:hypothetical protein